MNYFLIIIALFLFLITAAFLLVCCGKLVEFSGSHDDGRFYVFSANKLAQIKAARFVGKLILLPLLLYTLITETIAMVLIVIYLFIKGCFIYLLNKDEKFIRSISKAFGYSRWRVVSSDEKLITYNLMGYQWSRPYTIADIEI